MLGRVLVLTVFIVFVAACGSAESTDANANSANIPPEFSNQPIAPDGNSTPGIPDANMINPGNMPKGGTPTPGIPDPANIGKPIKGTTPTPGIPDAETLKRQANTIITDINQVNNPKNTASGEKPEKDVKRQKP